MLERFAEQFTDHRDPELIEHSVRVLVGQRVLGLALGYEDLNGYRIHKRLILLRAAVQTHSSQVQ
ncbi:MAG: transposase [Gammaproteobacteria bacterium]|nr:transposase [Gammaproteobacteria bacterium]